MSFAQQENIVYAEVHGIGLVMDVFTPTGPKNGLGIIDVISGAWSSDRSKIRDHMLAQTFRVCCQKGYTVFAIRPGSISKFNGIEMRDNLNQGILWVKKHSKEYGIDPDRLGMMGASAGGHLALLATVTAADADPMSKKADTRVKAVGVFFPPTDLISFDKLLAAKQESDAEKEVKAKKDRRLILQALSLPRMPMPEMNLTEEKQLEYLTQVSPALLAKKGLPPVLIYHGDADPLVPLSQSEQMVEALKKVEVPVELVVKKGGAHPWPTIAEEMAKLTDWFDTRL